MTCLAQISICLKAEFKQFLPVIIPSLKKDMDRDVKFSFEDAEEPEEQTGQGEEDSGITSLAVKIKGLEGAKQISIDTFALETKI